MRRRRRPPRRQIAEALPEIVEHFVKQAKGGSVAHAKALSALGSMDLAESRAKVRHAARLKRRSKSLTEQLMEELRRGRECVDGSPMDAPEETPDRTK